MNEICLDEAIIGSLFNGIFLEENQLNLVWIYLESKYFSFYIVNDAQSETQILKKSVTKHSFPNDLARAWWLECTIQKWDFRDEFVHCFLIRLY